MADTIVFTHPSAAVEEVQQGWHELKLKVEQLEAGRTALEQDNKALRSLLERVIEHRQKSHGELVFLLTNLVSKLPVNDVGVIVTRLMEHGEHVNEILAALGRGKLDAELPQPTILKALDQAKRDLVAAAKATLEELAGLETPLEEEMLHSLVAKPELFFSPKVVRASRCFVKGLLPRERIVRQVGEAALPLFTDMTTDPKLNPRPKPEEIALVFKEEFEALLPKQPGLSPDQQKALQTLHTQVQRSKGNGEEARAQKDTYARLSFILDLLHYYENQNTEAPDVVFAQRLPALIEQLAVAGHRKKLDEKPLVAAEQLLALVMNPEHRLMIVNNVGKGGGLGRTLKFVLRLRLDATTDLDQVISDFVRHMLPPPPQKPPSPQSLAALLRLMPDSVRAAIARAIGSSDRIPKEQARALAKALAEELALTGVEEKPKAAPILPPETERQMAWDQIKDLIRRRTPAAAIAAAIRDRLHAKYDADELRHSWIVLTEADAISLIRVFCHLPYREDGKTDPIAHTVMQTYLSRLMHEKYAAVYHKVVTSLKNMFKAKPDSPTLVNFLALVKWADAEAAKKLGADIGMAAHT